MRSRREISVDRLRVLFVSYMATIRVNRKNRYLGLFPTVEAASEAYRAAAIEVFGEFANG